MGYKPMVVFTTLLLFFSGLLLGACGPQKVDKEYVGESDNWSMRLEVKPLSFEEDEHRYVVNMEAEYLGDYFEIENLDLLRYEYLWIYEDAEYVDDESLDAEFKGHAFEPKITAFGGGAGLRRQDDSRKYFGQFTIEEDISDFADYIRWILEWNEQEEMLEVEKIN